ncbi:glycosyltransferase, partial [Streptomyces sp. 150FB]|uniref:glycosyltransferase n=1 Tax=Streptomyces sp. 150FB TaxID=1576605 RepID=UPI00191C584F
MAAGSASEAEPGAETEAEAEAEAEAPSEAESGAASEVASDAATSDAAPSGAGPTGASTAVLDLTVVVPAYNEERRLRPTLDAIRAYLCADPDRWGDWELIVVDDGSTDGTAAIA